MQHEKIRQFKRQAVSLRGVLRVYEDDSSQVRFSNTLETAASGKQLSVTVIDVGYGGLGLHSEVFIPRQARFEIEVFKDSDHADVDGEVLLMQDVTAKRCSMVSRDPKYFVGMGFDSVSIDLKKRLDDFIQSNIEDGPNQPDQAKEEGHLADRGGSDDS